MATSFTVAFRAGAKQRRQRLAVEEVAQASNRVCRQDSGHKRMLKFLQVVGHGNQCLFLSQTPFLFLELGKRLERCPRSFAKQRSAIRMAACLCCNQDDDRDGRAIWWMLGCMVTRVPVWET